MATYDCGHVTARYRLATFPHYYNKYQSQMDQARQALIAAGLLLSDEERSKLALKLATDTPISQLIINARRETY